MFFTLNAVPVVAVVIIALLYALFDLFNNREVPDLFAYASVVIAFLLALSYYSGFAQIVAFVTALAIAACGYVFYRSGVLGAGDVFLAVVITLIIPLQPTPFLAGATQPVLPFIISVFIASGYASLIGVVIYYLLIVKASPLEKGLPVERRKILLGLSVIVMYGLLIVGLYSLAGLTVVGAMLLLLLAIPSALLILFERKINCRMIGLVRPSSMTPGDMIATNLMKKSEIKYFSKKSAWFGRLATRQLIHDLGREKKLLPVYRNAVPLALFIFIGLIIAFAYGNLLFVILVH